jgi:hypothetical protein
MLKRLAGATLVNAAIVAMLAISFAGCSSSTTTPPDSDAVYAPASSLLSRSTVGKLTVGEDEAITDSIPVTSEFGGALNVGDESVGISGLDIPTQATDEVDDGSHVSMMKMKVTRFGQVTAELGPDGRKFKKPVWLKLSYKGADLTGIDESKLVILYMNEDLGVWEVVEGSIVDTVKKRVSAPLNHFSRYGVGSDE